MGKPMSLRGADERTGVNHVTIGEMLNGKRPAMETVVRWASGFRLDLNEWLELYDYPRIQLPAVVVEDDEETYHQRIARRIDEIRERLSAEGIPIPLRPVHSGGSGGLTPEDADVEAAEIERVFRQVYGPKKGPASGGDPESGKGKPNGPHHSPGRRSNRESGSFAAVL